MDMIIHNWRQVNVRLLFLESVHTRKVQPWSSYRWLSAARIALRWLVVAKKVRRQINQSMLLA